jgi:hypothetical protein
MFQAPRCLMDEPEVFYPVAGRRDNHFPISHKLRDDGTDGMVATVARALPPRSQAA